MMSPGIWSLWARRYERLAVQRFVLEPSRRLVMRHLHAIHPPPLRILDLGCGVGQLAYEVALSMPHAVVVGCDPSPGMIERARADYRAPNVEYVLGDIACVAPHPPFHAVVSTNALPYVADKRACLLAVHARLAPGGDAFILHANADTLYDRFVLALVKLTVSRAEYLSVAALESLMSDSGFILKGKERLNGGPLVPTITLVHGRKR